MGIKRDKNEIIEVQSPTDIVQTDVDTALAEWKAYQRITLEMLDESDYQTIKGKKYKKKSAWRKYARAFNISTEIMSKKISRNEEDHVTEAEFVVRATLPNGRYADGWGNCSSLERGFNHPQHDIPATAQTRATNRAISDLIGAGEVTAEEMASQPKSAPKSTMKNRNDEFEVIDV